MLILPEVFEAVRRQGRVADRGHNRSVAEIGLDGASVVAVVGELETAGMPQHVGMHEEREFRSHASPGNHALISGYGQRRAALRDEDVWGGWGFAQEFAQRAAFPCRYRMQAGIPAFGPAYMQAPGGEVDVRRFCLAASTRRSTSRSVRYSRPRLPTVTFTEVGAASRSREFSMRTALRLFILLQINKEVSQMDV